MSENHRRSLSLKVKKAQGQLAKVATMIEQEEYCIDIIHQNLAVIGLLKSTQQDLLAHHLRHCFQTGLNDPRRHRQMIDELLKVFCYSNKS
jgi:DNA-binding FrmR family transcriptional regulator